MKLWIYQITDLTNGNYYIGSSCSCKGFNHRKSQHKNDLVRFNNQVYHQLLFLLRIPSVEFLHYDP